MARKLVTAAVAVLLGCGDAAPLRIAVVDGSGSHYAAELAAEDINAAGGINGRLLELRVIVESDDVSPQQAIAVADTLSRDASILAVIGHGGSATSLAASQVYNSRHLPQMAPTTTTPLYTRAGPYSFRMVASDEHQAEFIARHIEAVAPHGSIAILYVNDDYGLALRGFVVSSLQRRGLRPRYESPFIDGPGFDTTATEIVRSMRAVQPDIVVWIGLSRELQVFRPRLREVAPRARVVGSDGVSFIVGTDPEAFEGDWVVALADVHGADAKLTNVASRFRPLADREFTDAAALTYDALRLIAEAMRGSGTSRDGIQRYLASGSASGRSYQGITGHIVLDEHGDARPSYTLLQVMSGRTRVVTK